MDSKENELSALLDFDLLKRLVVGIGEVSKNYKHSYTENQILGRKGGDSIRK